MNISAANMAIVIIQSQYEGGVRRFLEEGGDMAYVPEPIDKVFVMPGGLTDNIKDKINSTLGDKIEFTRGINFKGSIDISQGIAIELAKYFDENKVPAGAIAIHPVVNTISLPTIRKGSNLAKSLEKLISNLQGHYLTYCLYENGFKRLESIVSKTECLSPDSNTGRPEREQVISVDDIDNLKIALGLFEKEGDFDRFLKQI